MTDETLKNVFIFALAIICVLVAEHVIFPYIVVPYIIPYITSALSESALSNYPDSGLLRYPGIMP